MVRDLLKRVARKVIGRKPTSPPAPSAPPAARWTPMPASSAPEEEEEDQGHSHSHGHSHGHSHDHDASEEDGPSIEVEGEQLKGWLGEDLVLVDIREPRELESGHAQGAILIPMNQVPHRLAEIPKGKRVVVYCAAGGRSFGVTGYLRENGYPDAWSLAGGFSAYVGEGGKWLRPPSKVKYPVASRVRVTRDGLGAGTVQEIVEVDGAPVYTVAVVDEGGKAVRVSGLAESELERPKPV
jgi:rhodanese-related sulfurtransferase